MPRRKVLAPSVTSALKASVRTLRLRQSAICPINVHLIIIVNAFYDSFDLTQKK